jgi:hypothetical protein
MCVWGGVGGRVVVAVAVFNKLATGSVPRDNNDVTARKEIAEASRSTGKRTEALRTFVCKVGGAMRWEGERRTSI